MTTFSKTPLLDTIRTPEDLRRLKIDQVRQVADELRQETIDAVMRGNPIQLPDHWAEWGSNCEKASLYFTRVNCYYGQIVAKLWPRGSVAGT